MIYVPEVPETPHSQRERGRLTAQGRRSDDDTNRTLLIINEADGSWTIHGLGAPGVKLLQADTIGMCEAILERAR